MPIRTFTVTVTKTFGEGVLVKPEAWSGYVVSSVPGKFSGLKTVISYATLSSGVVMKANQKVSSGDYHGKYGLIKASSWGFVYSRFAASKLTTNPSAFSTIVTGKAPVFFDIRAALKRLFDTKIYGPALSSAFADSKLTTVQAGLNLFTTNFNIKYAGGSEKKLYGAMVYQNGYTVTVTNLTYSFWS